MDLLLHNLRTGGREALRHSPCPLPIGGADTVAACICAGNCGCENRGLLTANVEVRGTEQAGT